MARGNAQAPTRLRRKLRAHQGGGPQSACPSCGMDCSQWPNPSRNERPSQLPRRGPASLHQTNASLVRHRIAKCGRPERQTAPSSRRDAPIFYPHRRTSPSHLPIKRPGTACRASIRLRPHNGLWHSQWLYLGLADGPFTLARTWRPEALPEMAGLLACVGGRQIPAMLAHT